MCFFLISGVFNIIMDSKDLFDLCKLGYVNEAISLLENNPKLLNDVKSFGRNPFHYACESGNISLVKYMHSLDDSIIDKYTSMNITPMHYACLSGNIDLVKCLVSIRPNIVKVVSVNGYTVFHCACKSGNLELVKYLYTLVPSLITVFTSSDITPLHNTSNISIYAFIIDKLNYTSVNKYLSVSIKRSVKSELMYKKRKLGNEETY